MSQVASRRVTGRRRPPWASSTGGGLGLAARLVMSQLLVLGAAVLTAWLVATVIGPTIFHRHLSLISQHDSPAQAAAHAEQAFRDASVISLAVALATALAVALVVSAYVTRRITRPVTDLARAAATVAGGDYDVAVTSPGMGSEFDTLASSFATMATRLRDVEATRRRLLSDLAHEMRTPIATVDAYLEAFEDGVATPDRATLGVLRGQTRRLSRLAEDVTAVSRAEEHRLSLDLLPVDPGDLTAAAVDAATDRYTAAGVSLDAHAEAGLPTVLADPERFAQVMGNLLDNALRHTPAGGAVTVTARTGAAPDHRSHSVVIEVTDTGEGIATDALPHVFERFYRVDRARDRAHGGSGIGLAIVKALVAAHGGRVTASSPGPGRGATFTITLPVHPTSGRVAGGTSRSMDP